MVILELLYLLIGVAIAIGCIANGYALGSVETIVSVIVYAAFGNVVLFLAEQEEDR